MKKLTSNGSRRNFIKSGLLFVPGYMAARAASPIPQTPARGIVIASGCSTLQQDISDTANGNFAVANNSSRKYGAAQFTASFTGTCCRIDLPVYKTMTPTMNATIELWSNNATPTPDEPNALITAGSSRNAADFSATDPMPSGTWTSWTSLNFSLTSGTIYWIVLNTDAQDATHFFNWSGFGGFGSGLGETDNDGTGPWSLDYQRTPGIRLYTA